MGAMPNDSAGYMPQLDGLRAIAVIAVLLHHFIDTEYLPLFLSQIPFGYLGVRLFFVLSGFLITGILLRERLAIESGHVTISIAFRQFYIRRFLRIFPLYYLVIAITLAFGLEEATEYWLSLSTYTFNIEISLQGWYPSYFAHFWSLSVEEQYYVFWPWLILVVRRKFLVPATVLLVAFAPIFRCLAYLT
jgi:peptidoglycan/LPS O-acetylase OafA/YrhL